MLSKLLTFEKDILVINHPKPIDLVELLLAQASNRRDKLAIQALLDFYKDDRDALANGHYHVVVTENLIKGCTYELFYQALEVA